MRTFIFESEQEDISRLFISKTDVLDMSCETLRQILIEWVKALGFDEVNVWIERLTPERDCDNTLTYKMETFTVGTDDNNYNIDVTKGYIGNKSGLSFSFIRTRGLLKENVTTIAF